MLVILLLICLSWSCSKARHFDGGTIRWEPLNPYDNSSTVSIKITQSYNWAFPTIKCKNNVPITTNGRSGENANLTCTADCTSDGGYSANPINILTDCTSSSASLGMMSSQSTKMVNLSAGAHFYLANLGSAWIALNSPPQSNLQWSIVTFIDLRKRSDGFINTPPVAVVSSPQYAFVNQTINITIPVSDDNLGDDVRCRWSRFTSGYRRRREAVEPIELNFHVPKQPIEDEYDGMDDVENEDEDNDNDSELILSRHKRAACTGGCWKKCLCTDPVCIGTTCNGTRCTRKKVGGCLPVLGPNETTTTEVPGTLKSTSSFAQQQTIDECGDICYPESLPPNTTLNGCTISFTGTVAGAWYGVAVQVEDFINSNSTVAMSSVPVQFLIFVQPAPDCSIAPIIRPLASCLEAQEGVQTTFTIYAENHCDPNETRLSDILMSTSLAGVNSSDLVEVTSAGLLAYVIFTWKPAVTQMGYQQLCFVAYTDEQVQSAPYCATFNVKNNSDICTTTTSTATTSTSSSTTSTSTQTTSSTSSTSSSSTSTTTDTSTSTTSIETTSTTSDSTTSTTSTTTDTTTTTSQTTTTTSSSTSTSTTTTDTTATSTSSSSSSTTSTTSTTTETTTSTSSSSTSTTTTTSTTTSTTATTTSTSTSSTTSTTSTSSSTTSTTTTTTTTATTTTTTTATTTTITTTTTTKFLTTTKKTSTSPNGLLIIGLSLLGLLLACCCLCCWLYCFLWGGIGKRRRRRQSHQEKKRNKQQNIDFHSEIGRYKDLSNNHQSISRLSRQTMDTELIMNRSLSAKSLLPDKTVENKFHMESSKNNLSQTHLPNQTIKPSMKTEGLQSREQKIQVKHIRRIDIDEKNKTSGMNSTMDRHSSQSTISQSAILIDHRQSTHERSILNTDVTIENESTHNASSKASRIHRISVNKVPHNELPRSKRASRSHSKSRRSVNQVKPTATPNAAESKTSRSNTVTVKKISRTSIVEI